MIGIITLIAVILADRISKIFAATCLLPIGTFPIIKDVLHFTYVENTGAAFGMLKNSRWVFMIVSTVVIIAIGIYMYINRARLNKTLSLALCLILSGGIGNMIDRICYGYVIDFIDLRLINFAVFNIADSALTIGAVILVYYVLIAEPKQQKPNKQSGENTNEQQ